MVLKVLFQKIKYKKWILSAAAILLIGLVTYFSYRNYNKPLCDKCNVILVSIDTLSALHLPCYGYKKNTAPALCRYAKDNLFFLNSYSQSPTTQNSHFSIFTSLYPHTHNMVRALQGNLDEKYKTLAQIYKNNGYQTFYNAGLTDSHLPITRGIERGFDILEGNSTIESWDTTYKRINESVDKKRPFFAFLHTYSVHDPYLVGHKEKHLYTDISESDFPYIALTSDEYNKVTPEFLKFVVDTFGYKNTKIGFPVERYANFKSDFEKIQQIKKTDDFIKKKSLLYSLTGDFVHLCFYIWNHNKIKYNDPKQTIYLAALYDESINILDEKIQKLFELVNSPKFSKNTILIITSDHGEEFMEHGNYYHGVNVYSTSTRVPLIIHIPGVAPKTLKEMVQGIDIYPTILSVTGFKPVSPIQGLDLTGLIKGNKDATTNKYLLSEFENREALQLRNWRVYFDIDKNKIQEVYDLNNDPGEKINLLDKSAWIEPEVFGILNKLKIKLPSNNQSKTIDSN